MALAALPARLPYIYCMHAVYPCKRWGTRLAKSMMALFPSKANTSLDLLPVAHRIRDRYMRIQARCADRSNMDQLHVLVPRVDMMNALLS